MATGIFSLLGNLLEELNKASSPNTSPAANMRRPRQIPVESLKEMLGQGKREAAIVFLRNYMHWDLPRATKFIDDLSYSATLSKPQRVNATKSSTSIEKLISEHQQQEQKAGGSLIWFLIQSFRVRQD